MFAAILDLQVSRCALCLPLQNVTFGDAIFTLKVTALPEFIKHRQTTNPQFVLGFSVSIVLVLVVLFGLTAIHSRHREVAQLKAETDRRQQEIQVINAAKEAHETTIAYACHQLRSEARC